MLIGQKSNINDKLVEEISEIFTISFWDINDVINGVQNTTEPRIIIINLMDINVQEDEILNILKNKHPHAKVIGIHCYQSPKMIEKTLSKGYDGYLSIFNLSEELGLTLKEQHLIE